MEASYSYSFPLPISRCDLTGRLGVADVFSLFMDAAAIHAQQLGVGAEAMIGRGLFWLTGSQHFDMMRRVQETLAGRVGILKLYGFSQREKAGRPFAGELDFSFEGLMARVEGAPWA